MRATSKRRVKVLDKRLPGSLEHSEGDCAVCATRRAACEGFWTNVYQARLNTLRETVLCVLQDERRVKVLDKRLPGSLEHSEETVLCAEKRAACEGSGQTFTRLA